MGLKVVGAGLGRTGTHSLKIALEQLLGGTCYHMVELLPRPEHVPLWHGAMLGNEPDWDTMLADFTSGVDWPVAAVWEELHGAFPDSVVLLSTRSSPEGWWKSFSETILQVMLRGEPAEESGMQAWYGMAIDMLDRMTPDYADRDGAIAGYNAHNERVRATVAPDRLIDWTPADGWGPVCAGLGLPEPTEPFPHVNTTDDFRATAGLDS